MLLSTIFSFALAQEANLRNEKTDNAQTPAVNLRKGKTDNAQTPAVTLTCNSGEYLTSMQKLVDSAPSRDVADDGIYKAEEYIRAELRKACNEENVFDQKFSVSGRDAFNIVGFLPGTSTQFYVLGAHHDSTSDGKPTAPGVDDNGAGTVDLLQIAKLLKDTPNRQYGIVFASFSAEEEGLLGSQEFVKNKWFQDRKKDFLGALILDQLGTNMKDGNQFIFETKHLSNAENAVQHILGALSAALPSDAQKDEHYNAFGSDHMTFLNEGLPSVLLISRNNEKEAAAYGHTENDDMSVLELPYAVKACSLALRTVYLLLAPASMKVTQTQAPIKVAKSPAPIKVPDSVQPVILTKTMNTEAVESPIKPHFVLPKEPISISAVSDDSQKAPKVSPPTPAQHTPKHLRSHPGSPRYKALLILSVVLFIGLCCYLVKILLGFVSKLRLRS